MVEAAHAPPAWVLLAYLIAGVCFILALRGLSSPETSRRGNFTGMIGMAIAVGRRCGRTCRRRSRRTRRSHILQAELLMLDWPSNL